MIKHLGVKEKEGDKRNICARHQDLNELLLVIIVVVCLCLSFLDQRLLVGAGFPRLFASGTHWKNELVIFLQLLVDFSPAYFAAETTDVHPSLLPAEVGILQLAAACHRKLREYLAS